MRARKINDDNGNGIMCWDDHPDKDPRKACFTCRFFCEETASCENRAKQFIPDDRKIFYYKLMRCNLHSFHGDFNAFMKSEYSKKPIDEIKRMRQDLEMEFSLLRDYEMIKGKYKEFLTEKPPITSDVKQEIDIDLHFKKFYKDLPNAFHVDDIDFAQTRFFQNKVWIYGYDNPRLDYCNPIHHSLLSISRQKFSIEFSKIRATFYKNGESFKVDGSIMIDALKDPLILHHAFEIATTYKTILYFLNSRLRECLKGPYWLDFAGFDFINEIYFENLVDFQFKRVIGKDKGDVLKDKGNILILKHDVIKDETLVDIQIKYMNWGDYEFLCSKLNPLFAKEHLNAKMPNVMENY